MARWTYRGSAAFLVFVAMAYLPRFAGAQIAIEAEESQETKDGEGVLGDTSRELSERSAKLAVESGPIVSGDDQARLGEWMDYTAKVERRARVSGGATQLVVSSLTMTVGILLYLDKTPNNELNKGIGISMVGTSGVFMAVGIYQLAKKGDAELRLQRWKKASSSTMSAAELSRFEGELRAESEAGNRSLKLARWTSFGLAMTGGLLLGLTPAASLSNDATTVGYIVGGATLGVGLVGFSFSFLGKGPSNYYEAYKQGRAPAKNKTRVRATPAIGRHFVGGQIAGRF